MEQEAVDGSKPKIVNWEEKLGWHVVAMKCREQDQRELIDKANHKLEAIIKERMELEHAIYEAKNK